MYKSNQTTYRPKRSAVGLAYLLGAIACGAGIGLVPLSGAIADILIILAFCMTIVIPMIIGNAKQPWEIGGFPQLVGFISLVRFSMLAMIIKSAFTAGDAGFVLNSISRFVPQSLPVCIIALSGIVIFSMVLIQSSLASVIRNTKKAITEIIPAKAAGLDHDLQSSLINDEQAQKMRERINKEASFYAGCRSICKVLMLESWLGVTAICVAITFILAQLKTNPTSGYDGHNVITGSAFATIIQLCIAWLSAGIINKGSFKLKNINPEDEKKKSVDFEQTFRDIDSEENFELLNPDFDTVRKCIANLPEPAKAIITDESASSKVIDDNIKIYNSADEYYDELTSLICRDSDKQIIFLDSPTNQNLPVTIPVNCAIRLSQAGLKVLLVDAERQRQAIGEVFELTINSDSSEPLQTCIENIYVANAGRQIDANEYAALNVFDKIVVYAPESDEIIREESSRADMRIVFEKNVPIDNPRNDVDNTGNQKITFSAPDYENWQS